LTKMSKHLLDDTHFILPPNLKPLYSYSITEAFGVNSSTKILFPSTQLKVDKRRYNENPAKSALLTSSTSSPQS
jgi:hypothetical protein